MEILDKVWDYLTKLPQLLDQYSTYSYPLLAVLLAAGLLILGAHLYRRARRRPGFAAPYVVFGSVLAFLAVGGFVLKAAGDRQTAEAARKAQEEKVAAARKAHDDFVNENKAPSGEHWVLVFDFTFPPGLEPAQRDRLLHRMELMVASLSEGVLEDLPAGFRQPKFKRVEIGEALAREGVDQTNFKEISRQLNASEVVWGNVHEQGRTAKAFLGIPRDLPGGLDEVHPLRELDLEQDPRHGAQFAPGYYRLLGLVSLGIVLDTLHRAREAKGDERRRLFLLAVDQIARARERSSNHRDDVQLKKTLFGPAVDELLRTASKEAGLEP